MSPSPAPKRACSQSRGCSVSRGFSLIELMIVLTIFGMLIGFGIPSYNRYSQTQQLRGASENLVQTLQLQRARAMANGQSVTINFNTAMAIGSL